MGTVPSHDAEGNLIPDEALKNSNSHSTTNHSASSNSTSDFPSDGVRLSYLPEFIDKECGGREKIKDYTTYQICENFIATKTKEQRISYVDFLRKVDSDNESRKSQQIAPVPRLIRKAEVFISHAWSSKFIDVIDTLLEHFRDRPDVYIWFDSFTVNQHTSQNSNRPFSWWSTTFKDAIQDMGHTVMIFAPWKRPALFTRVWCMWELYCTAATNTRLDIAMTLKEKEDFLSELSTYDPEIPLNRMISAIDVEYAGAYNESDSEPIFNAISVLGGYRQDVDKAIKKDTAKHKGCGILNGIIFRELKVCVVNMLEGQLQNVRFDYGSKLSNKLTLGIMYYQQGCYEQAEPLLIECMECYGNSELSSEYGEHCFNRYVAMTYVGALHGKRNRTQNGESLLKEALTKKLALGDQKNVIHQVHIVHAYYELGKFYEMRVTYSQAREFYMRGLQLSDWAVKTFDKKFPLEYYLTGMNHMNRLSIIHPSISLNKTWDKMEEKLEVDFRYIHDNVNKLRENMLNTLRVLKVPSSDYHPIIVQAYINRARMYHLLIRQDGKMTEENCQLANQSFLDAIALCQQVMGERHPETIRLLKIASRFFNDLKVFYQIKDDKDNMLIYETTGKYFVNEYQIRS